LSCGCDDLGIEDEEEEEEEGLRVKLVQKEKILGMDEDLY